MCCQPKIKILFSLLIVLACSRSLGATEFFVEPNVGMVFGQVREIVYPVGYSTDNPYLSELIWDIKPAYMLGLNAGIVTKGDIVFSLSFQGALPAESGEMYDYDWLYLNRSDWSHRSISDVVLSSGFIVEVDVEGRLVDRNRWSMTISGGYHMNWWSWTDYTKDIWYTTNAGSVYPNPPKDYDYGAPDPWRDYHVPGSGSTGITYSVAYHILYAGIGALYSGDSFSFAASYKIGPMLALDHDHHINTGTHYYDSGIGGPWMSLQTRFGLKTGTIGEFFLNLNISGCLEFRGNTDIYTDSGIYQGTVISGAGFQFQQIGFNLGYSFLF